MMFNREREDRDLDDELAAYVDGLIAEKIKAGMTPEAARRAALIETGGVEQVKEATRDVRAGILLETALKDFRFALRALARTPTYAIAAILTLGLAIGASATIYSIIDPVLLQPLPYRSPAQLAFVWERADNGDRDNLGYATYRDLVASSKTIQSAAVVGGWGVTLTDGTPERVTGDRVSWQFFRTLGVAPAIGRDFLSSEDTPATNQVVILSHALWMRRFHGDSAIAGKTISINDRPVTVVGVMPASFESVISPDAQIWRVLGYDNQPYACRSCHHLRMVVRIKEGGTMATAADELTNIHKRLERAYPKEYSATGAAVVPMQDEMTRSYKAGLFAVAAAVALILLIALANVLNLQLARALRRNEEFAVRAALGASKPRLAAQLFAEGTVLAIAGGIAGLVIAAVSLPEVVRRLPDQLPRLADIHLNLRAAGVVALIVLGVSLLMSFAPLGKRAIDFTALRSGRRASGANRATRAALVALEVALAMMLLVSAGLIGRSLRRLLSVDPGFDTSHLVAIEANSIGPRYASNESVYRYHDDVRAALGALPGVESVAMGSELPLGGGMDTYGVVDPLNMPANPELAPYGARYAVSPEFFSAMRIQLLRGRLFTPAEAADTTHKIVVISEGLAREVFAGKEPIGQHLRFGDWQSGPDRLVIGVVGDVRSSGLDATTNLQWYVPERQWSADNSDNVVVRTKGDPVAAIPLIRKTLASVDPTQPLTWSVTMEQMIGRSTAQRRLALVLFVFFAVAALLLAMTGIYGVLAGSVVERTREIGVRSALGATPGDIVGMIVRQGGLMAGAGILLGGLGAIGGSKLLGTLLFDIGPRDPVTLIGVLVVLAATSASACVIPAIRASRVDPTLALRQE